MDTRQPPNGALVTRSIVVRKRPSKESESSPSDRSFVLVVRLYGVSQQDNTSIKTFQLEFNFLL